MDQKQKRTDAAEYLERRSGEMSHAPRCYIRTFGCQQNVSDSERIAGMMAACGYEITQSPQGADLIIFNTCAVREHAEDRVFGNVGEIKRLKEANRELVVALGGCMVQQKHIADKLRASYPFVDIIFNTNELQRLPEHIAGLLKTQKPVDAYNCDDYEVYEGLPVRRDETARAFVPVMYGCDNFCSYCVVPLVRGRERSRTPQNILDECRAVIAAGYKDVMLLGQNVNSYGKGLEESANFSTLLASVAELEGDFTLRFMTSHPKDATEELFSVISEHPKISRHIHLPVQSGSDEILRRMNRGYTRQEYLRLIQSARRVIDNVTFSSDIIIGFPGESEAQFCDTLSLVEEVGYRALFTFIYSKRQGTPAADLPDAVTHAEKAGRMRRLLDLQDEISGRQDAARIGSCTRALVTGILADGRREARLDDNSVITLESGALVNQFIECRVTSIHKKRFQGKDITP